MQLIYLYIGDIGRNIFDQYISFSDEYYVEYNKKEKKLQIKNNDTKRIYKKEIIGIDLLVGRNGSGKSTIMNLLGMGENQRRNEFHQWKENTDDESEKVHTWFAVYHIRNDLYAIEGYNPKVLTFLSIYDLQNEVSYSAVFRFNSKSQVATYIDHLQMVNIPYMGKKVIDDNRFLYHFSEQDRNWFEGKRYSDDIAYRMFPRYQTLGKAGKLSVLNYLSDALFETELKKVMKLHPKSVMLSIKLHNPYGEFVFSERKEEFSKCIYGAENLINDILFGDITERFNLKPMFSKSQSMVIRYLEYLIARKYDERDKALKASKVFKEDKGTQSEKYLHRKKYLLEYLKHMCKINVKDDISSRPVLYERDLKIIERVCSGIENIDEKYFKDSCQIVVPLIEYTKDMNFLYELMSALDYNDNDNSEEHEINQSYYIRASYSNLSSGEMNFIHMCAAIKTKVDNIIGKGTCILLMDEPDVYFHPEWSRQFVEFFTKLITSKSFNKFNYQIIMSTHSPILLADIPVNRIHCLNVNQENCVEICKAKYGFLNNINTIMIDSMFVSSSFGSFAEKYVNNLLREIAKIEKIKNIINDKERVLTKIHEIEAHMEIVKEPVIRKHLECRILSIREKIYTISRDEKDESIKMLLREIRRIEGGENM